jgi:hypothetical protein
MTEGTERDLTALARRRIRRAKAILGPGCCEASVEKTVWAVLVRQELHEIRRAAGMLSFRRPTNKQEREAVRRVASELRRLESALNNPAVPYFAKKLFPSDLPRRRVQLEALADARLESPSGRSPLQSDMPRSRPPPFYRSISSL